MKTGRVFWGVFFLVAGVLFLLDRITAWDLHIGLSWKFWPLLLVFIGLGLAIGGRVVRWVFAALGGCFLAILVASAFEGAWWHENDEWSDQSSVQAFHEAYTPGTGHASFRLLSGAGTFTLADTAGDLMTAETESRSGAYELDRTQGDSTVHLRLEYRGPERGWFRHGRNAVRIRLHPDPVWDVRFDVGASKLDIDASPLKVGSVEVAAGAADVHLKVGSRSPHTDVSVKTGASSVTIFVPESSACELQVKAPLSSTDFRGFEKVSRGFYRAGDPDTSANRVSISLDGGVSSLKVIRY